MPFTTCIVINLAILLGTIPIIQENSSLLTVYVEHNKLSHAILQSLFKVKGLKSIDLNGNKIKGTVPSEIFVYDINLETNRLSGPLQRNAFSNVSGVNILQSNTFSCPKSDLPSNDPDFPVYICGSESLDVALYVFFGSFGLFVTFLIISWYLGWETTKAFHTIHHENSNHIFEHLPNVKLYMLSLWKHTRLTIEICIIIFFAQLIAFPALKHISDYSTKTYQYTWVFSGTYFQGTGPLATLMIIGVFSTTYFAIKTSKAHTLLLVTKFTEDHIGEYFESTSLRTNLCIIIFLVFEFAGLICINIIYVLLFNRVTSEIELLLLQFALAMLNQWVQNFQVKSYIKSMNGILGIREFWVSVVVLSIIVLFNITVAPAISVLVISTNCLGYLFIGSDLEEAPYPLPFCRQWSDSYECEVQVFEYQVLSFDPPLIYNNDCRNEILTAFVPVFLISLAFMFAYPPVSYIVLTRYSNPSKSILHNILKIVGSIYWPSEKLEGPFRFVHNPLISMMKVNLFTGLALTVGITSPPLLVAIALTSLITYYMHHIMFVRFVNECPYPDIVQTLDHNCLDAWRSPYYFLWPAIIASYTFQFLFLLDMASDTTDSSQNFTSFSWIPSIYSVCLLSLRAYFYFYEKSAEEVIKQRVSKTHVEVRPATIGGCSDASVDNPMAACKGEVVNDADTIAPRRSSLVHLEQL